jgi:hypothetical protein
MMLLRFLNPQGIAGLATALALAVLLIVQKTETRHWKKQAAQFEQLYAGQRSAMAETVANYRAAAEAARAADRAAAERVEARQRSISERTQDDFQARLAAARSLAQRLRGEAPGAAADLRLGRAAPVSGLPAAAAGIAQAAGQDRFPQSDRLTATEQAIQLDELIRWTRAQAAVDPNAQSAVESQRPNR